MKLKQWGTVREQALQVALRPRLPRFLRATRPSDRFLSGRSVAALALVLATLSPSAGAPGTVSLNIGKVRLAEAVRVVSEQSGVTVRVTGDAQREIGPLNVEMPVERVLRLVGQMAGLTVQKEGEGYVLAPPAGGSATPSPGTSPTPSRPAAAGPRVEAAETIARVKPSVALIVAYVPAEQAFAQGTGFVVKGDNRGDLIVTNSHVIKDAAAIQILFPDNSQHWAAVAALDDDHDLAVLRIARQSREYLTLADGDPLREGDDVGLTGFPMAIELMRNGIPLYASTAKATVNAIRPARSMVTNQPMQYIQIDAPVNPGYSGGPLYRLDNGRVVGVVQSKIAYEQEQDLGVSFAIPINFLWKLLNEARANPVQPPTGEAAQRLAASIPAVTRVQPPPGVDGGTQPPASDAGPAITRPFELLPVGDLPSVPEPNATDGLIGMHAPGGKLVVDPGRPRLYATDFGGNSVVVIDTESGKVVKRLFTGSKPHGLAVAPDGKTLYVANSGGSEILALDLEKLAPVAAIPLSFHPFDLVFGPGGRLYATAAGTGRANLRAIDLRRQQEQAVSGTTLGGGSVLASSGTGEALFAAERGNAPVALFEFLAPGKIVSTAMDDPGLLGANLQDIALSPDGKRLYVASLSVGYVAVLDAEAQRPLGQMDVGGTPTGVTISPDGRVAYIAHRKNHVDCFDTRTFLRTGSIAVSDVPLHLAVSTDGKKLFVQMRGGIQICSAAAGPPAPEN